MPNDSQPCTRRVGSRSSCVARSRNSRCRTSTIEAQRVVSLRGIDGPSARFRRQLKWFRRRCVPRLGSITARTTRRYGVSSVIENDIPSSQILISPGLTRFPSRSRATARFIRSRRMSSGGSRLGFASAIAVASAIAAFMVSDAIGPKASHEPDQPSKSPHMLVMPFCSHRTNPRHGSETGNTSGP
jgi:hypothetical protein